MRRERMEGLFLLKIIEKNDRVGNFQYNEWAGDGELEPW